jgi:hypothetical protein
MSYFDSPYNPNEPEMSTGQDGPVLPLVRIDVETTAGQKKLSCAHLCNELQ